jgi:hypothetical protein
VTTSTTHLRPSETIVEHRASVPVHFQRHGQLRANRMKCDVALTTERIVGTRRFGSDIQITPDVDRSRITHVDVVETLRMRGVSRRAFKGHFLRLELEDPDTTVALLLDEATARAWAAELTEPEASLA